MGDAPSSTPPGRSSKIAWRSNRPNMLITGTPGVGKTTMAKLVSEQLGLRHIEVGQFARDRDMLAEYDHAHDAYFMHEDAVLDDLEPLMTEGAILLDHHSCDWYPERWIHLVVVLRVRTDTLFDRLSARGYAVSKVQENVQGEIMQVVFEEAVTSYPEVQVLELSNDTEHHRDANLITIKRAWNALNNDTIATSVS